jgi:hypothetical protein
MAERGANAEEVAATIREGEQFPAKFGRTGFRRDFPVGGQWRGRDYASKQIEVIATFEDNDWLAISVIVKYF